MSDLDRLEALFAVREPDVRAFMRRQPHANPEHRPAGASAPRGRAIYRESTEFRNRSSALPAPPSGRASLVEGLYRCSKTAYYDAIMARARSGSSDYGPTYKVTWLGPLGAGTVYRGPLTDFRPSTTIA